MVQEQVFSFLNKIRSSRISEASLASLSKLSSGTLDQMPVLSTDAIEFYSVWISKKSFPLSFFIESLSVDQQKNLLKKYVESLESDLPLSFFIGLGLLRGPGKRTGAALLLPVNFNSQTKEFTSAGFPVENPVLAEMEGFPEPEAAQVEKKFSLQEYFRRLKIFISTQEGWKFTEKGVSLSLLPSEKFISAVRIGRLYRNIESEKLGKIANEFLGEGLSSSADASFDAARFRKDFHPADYVFPYPYDSEDTDALLKALSDEYRYFVLESLPGTDGGKTVSNLIAEAIRREKKTAVIASRPVTLQVLKETLLPPIFSDETPDYEKLELDLREKRKPFELYYSQVSPENGNTPLVDIMQELSKNRKKSSCKLNGAISEKLDKLSLEECKEIASALDVVYSFKKRENATQKEQFFAPLNERVFGNVNFENKIKAIVQHVKTLESTWNELLQTEILEESILEENVKKSILEIKEILLHTSIDYPDWNVKLQDWDTFRETIEAFPSAGKIWSDFRNQGSNEFTPNAIDTNIWLARETFSQLRKTRMKHMSENYLSSKKLLKSTLRDPKIASNDDALQKYADKLLEIQESRNTYKNSAALAQRLFGKDWNYEKTDWGRLEKKIKAFYALKEKNPSSFKLNILKHAYLFKDSVKELDEFVEKLDTYETLLRDLSFYFNIELFPKDLKSQFESLNGILEYFSDLVDYEEYLKATNLLNEKDLNEFISNQSLLQDQEISKKILQSWIAGALQRLAKQVPDLFSKTAKTRIKESKEFRKSYDLWAQANIVRVRDTLKQKPELLTLLLEKKLTASPRCDLLIVLDAETISVADFLLYAQSAKKVILVGDEHLPMGVLDSGNVLLHVLRLGAPQRKISFAFGCRHPQMLQFASANFYENGIRTFPLPDSSREKPFCKHLSDEPQQLLVQAIVKHAETHPARTLGVIAFSKEEVSTLKRMLQNTLKGLPNLASFFKDRGCRNTFFISTPENAIGKKRDTIFFLVDGAFQGMSEGTSKINVCSTLADRELHFYVSKKISVSDSESGKLFQDLIDFRTSEIRTETLQVPPLSPILQELEKYALDEHLTCRINLGTTSISVGMGIVDENNEKRYLLAAEDDSLNGSLQHTIEDREYIRLKSAEMLGWKVVRLWTPTWFIFNEDEKSHFLTTVRIEQSIAPPKALPEELEEEAETTATSLVVPYQVTHPKIIGTPHDMPIPELSEKALLHQLRFYVESESPIHEQQLISRMLSLHKISRPGPKILQILQDGIRLSLQQKNFIKTGPFFYSRTPKEIQPRYRGDLPDSERLLQFVPPEERALLPSDEAVIKEMLGLL